MKIFDVHLTNIGNNQIISGVNYYHESRMGYCNMFEKSHYLMNIHLNTNFYIRISQSFPFVESLSLTNPTP
jgi:hypothetical protein